MIVVRWLMLCCAALLAVAANAATDGRRVALVIGNGGYEHSPPLANPANDARAMAELLQGMGFDVVNAGPGGPGLVDLDLDGMRDALALFGRQARGAEIAAVFYAGHGLEVGGVNYLLPVDAQLRDELDLPLEAVDLDTLMRFASVASTRIVLLDACRDNPLAARMTVSAGTRSIGRGLAQIDQVATGTLLGYATSPGAVASDGAGTHSPYTAALLAHLATPGVSITDSMTRVNASVQDATGGAQIPWTNSSLREVIALAGPAAAPEPEPDPASAPAPETLAFALPAASPAPAIAPEDNDLLDWRLAARMNTVAAYRAYIATHCPGGHGCALAQASVGAIDAAEVAGASLAPAERRAAAEHPMIFDMAALATPPAAPEPTQPAPPMFALPSPAAAGAPAGPAVLPPQAAATAPATETAAEALAYQDGLDRRARREVQRRLTLIGFDTRGVDGVFGRNTETAIAGWQAARGLQPTGVIGRAQHAALTAESAAEFDAWSARAARAAREAKAEEEARTYQRAVAPAETEAEAPKREENLIENLFGKVKRALKENSAP